MAFMMSIILSSIFINFVLLVHCAPELLTEESCGIVFTERVIRNTVNNLFSSLILKVPEQNLKLNKYSTIHNVFAAITVQDDDNLKKIANVTRLDNIDNGTRVFITQLNEALNEDNKSDEAPDSVYVTILIQKFLSKLDRLKEKFNAANTTKYFDVNKAIIGHFNKVEKEFGNTTNLIKEKHVKGNHSNYRVLSSNGSWKPSRRIFEGRSVKIKRFPFMASILFFDRFQCAGSILKQDLIITSASCLQLAWNNRFYRENPSFLSVHVGSNFYKQGGENIPISEIHFHPNYNTKTLQNNLALMRLTRVIKIGKYSDKVRMIDFDRHANPLPSNINGIVVVGWGATSSSNKVKNPLVNKLRYAILDFYPLDECQAIYSKEFVTDRNFCAGFYSKGGGACNHDAGGPGISSGTLLGVISFGSPMCGTPDAPTVFTKLGYYTDWIEEIMEMQTITRNQLTTVRPLNTHTFRLTFYETVTKLTPVIKQRTTREIDGQDMLRMSETDDKFKHFLKMVFKKTKPKKERRKKVTDVPDKTEDVQEIAKLENITEKDEEPQKQIPSNTKEIDEDYWLIKDILEPHTDVKNEHEKVMHDNETQNTTYFKTLTPSPNNLNIKEDDQELDDATDSLNIDYFLESDEDSFEVSIRAKSEQQETKDQSENVKLIESKSSSTDVTKDKEKIQSSWDKNKDLNAKDKYHEDNRKVESENDSGKDESDEIVDRIQSFLNAESHKSQEKGLSTGTKNKDYELSYESDTDDGVELLSIPAESFKQDNSSSTEKLLDMLDYEDVVKLLIEEVIR